MLDVPVVRLDPDLPLPAYARPGDAGADLVAREDAVLEPGGGAPWCPRASPWPSPRATPASCSPAAAWPCATASRASTRPGLIDAGYRDELKVLLVNTDPTTPYKVSRGDRIAQLVIQRVEEAAFQPVDELPPSERGWAASATRGRRGAQPPCLSCPRSSRWPASSPSRPLGARSPASSWRPSPP